MNPNTNTRDLPIFVKHPMGACTVKMEALPALPYPMHGQQKFDGVRVLVTPLQGVITRKGKPVANLALRAILSTIPLPDGFALDAELTTTSGWFKDADRMVRTRQSSADGHVLRVFDLVPTLRSTQFTPFAERIRIRDAWLASLDPSDVKATISLVETTLLKNKSQARQYVFDALNSNYEGAILRSSESLYVQSRSTLASYAMLRFKFVETVDCKVLSMWAAVDKFGNTKSELGSLVVTSLAHNMPFSVGTGFTSEQRVEIWRNSRKYTGAICEIEYLRAKLIDGVPDRARQPSFRGWKDV